MPDEFCFGPWDVVWIAAVTLQAGFIAYLHAPKWKALVFSLPIPFTAAVLAVDMPIGATNATGLLLFVVFVHGVRVLHYNLRLPIVPSIAICVLGYCAGGKLLLPIIPSSEIAFWIAIGAILAAAILLNVLTPERLEPGHRSPLGVYVKIPAVMLIVASLVMTKPYLQGFVTMFPMIGVITVDEAPKSIWTVCKQIPAVLVVLTLMLVVCRLGQDRVGVYASLLIGWCAVMCFLIPYTLYRWARWPTEEP